MKRSWRNFLNVGQPSRTRTPLDFPRVSLLWKGDALPLLDRKDDWIVDLGLDQLISSLTQERRYAPFIGQVLSNLVMDGDTIRWRQAVMRDFISNPAMTDLIAELLPRLSNLKFGSALLGRHRRNVLLETSDRLAELDLYTEVVEELAAILDGAELQSDGLSTLRRNVSSILDDENFQTLRDELPDLRKPLENIGSLTIGINLDYQLQPEGAVLLAINDHKLGESVSLLTRLIGSDPDAVYDEGIAPAHQLIKDPDMRLLSPLFQDLDRLLSAVAQPIARALEKYVRASSSPLVSLEYELAFFVFAAKLQRELGEQGISCTTPDVLAVDSCAVDIRGLRNINLLLSESKSVASDVRFDNEGRIAVLTGPNSGGKTTYLQSAGLAQVMFQAGMMIPAESASLSPVDNILTHFPRLETRQEGRLAEEARRLREVFQQITPNSLILLNETFSSTTSGEAIYLAQDMLCGLRAIGVRALYATHFVELADHIKEIEETVEGRSRLFSLVAGVETGESGSVQPSFKITRGRPLGRSYAREIAKQYGISLEQILADSNTTAS